MFENKNVLVTGGTGMIGISLVKKLLEKGAKVHVASMDTDERRKIDGANYLNLDLTGMNSCLIACEIMDYVFHLAGIKGSPKMCAEQPADFMVPLLQFNTNMMEAARRMGVKEYLFTSSVGVYHPDTILREDDVWKTFPSEHDKFAGWAKRMGELQAEAYKIQYDWNNIYIVRPANVYGPFDNFDPTNSMVIPAMINKAINNGVIDLFDNGEAIRDFIYTDDVADGMIHVFEKEYTNPVNLGSGTGYSILTIANTIAEILDVPVTLGSDETLGDEIRLMDMTRAKDIGWSVKTDIKEGLQKTIYWYLKNQDVERYNAFTDRR
jgi:GDP-L-fucose synthase